MLPVLNNLLGLSQIFTDSIRKKTFPYVYKIYYKNADGKKRIQIINSYHNLSHKDVKGMTVKSHGVFIDIIKIEVYRHGKNTISSYNENT